MLQMHANQREDIKEARAGDIVALAGLRTPPPATRSAIPRSPVVLERMEFPDPVIEVAVEPKTKGDQEKMGVALNRLAQEDPVLPRVASIRRAARPSSRAWASCISRSSSTA